MQAALPGRNIILIGIPALLLLLLLVGMGGKGYLLLSILLLAAGGWLLARPLPPSRHRLLRALAYFIGLLVPFYLFS